MEFAAQAPVAFAGQLLADLGADVVRIDRAPGTSSRMGVLGRGRRSIALDLKCAADTDVARGLVDRADALIEGFRPGVMERLGFGPDICSRSNPRLVYGRLTGWGRSGPMSRTAGHDLNYIAMAGVLEPIGEALSAPIPPLNLLGDFAGGGMLLAFGVLAALVERAESGRGQVVDAAMVDGSALLGTFVYALINQGRWAQVRGQNDLDGSVPFYSTYQTADDAWISVAALESRFYAELLDRLGIEDLQVADQYDRTRWPELRRRLGALFRTRSRAEWEQVFTASDACVAVVLSPQEAPDHPYHVDRGTFIDMADGPEPRPAPFFSRTPAGAVRPAPASAGADAAQILVDWGLEDAPGSARA